MRRALAIDLGGTNMRAGLSDPQQPGIVEPLGHWDAPADLAAFTDRLRRLVAAHEADRVGIAVPGFASGTVCAWVPNLPFLDGVDLAAHVPNSAVALGNDAQLALLAEVTAGAAKGLSDAILLSIGTGIGSAVLSGSRIVRGAHGGAASFGWACGDIADAGDDRDGWLERNASGRALDDLARSMGFGNGGAGNGAALIARARAGDGEALRLLGKPARALGATLAGAVALLDPQAIIVTGGVASALDVLAPRILPALTRQLPAHLRGIRLVPGSFGPGASLAGAGMAALGSAYWGGMSHG